MNIVIGGELHRPTVDYYADNNDYEFDYFRGYTISIYSIKFHVILFISRYLCIDA